MSITTILLISSAIFVLLMGLAWETFREFGRMEKKPGDYTGSDRLAGTAE